MSVVRAFFDSFGLFRVRQSNWRIELTKKIARKSRNSRVLRGGKLGAEGMVTMLCSLGTKYKPSKDAFAFTCIVLTLVPLGTELLEIFAQFIEVPVPPCISEYLQPCAQVQRCSVIEKRTHMLVNCSCCRDSSFQSATATAIFLMLIAGRRCARKFVNKPTPPPLTRRLFLNSRKKLLKCLNNGDYLETCGNLADCGWCWSHHLVSLRSP